MLQAKFQERLKGKLQVGEKANAMLCVRCNAKRHEKRQVCFENNK